MELVVTLVALGVTWLPAGYMGARLFNATMSGTEFQFKWNKPVETEFGRMMFGISIVLGWLACITVALLLFTGLLLFIVIPLIIKPFAHFAPK